MKVNNRLRTKGRFQVEIPTNGLQNRMDTKWAQKANPEAHIAQLYRDQMDQKMLEKKKQSRELSSQIVFQKKQRKSKVSKVRQSMDSQAESQAQRSNHKASSRSVKMNE